MSLRSLGVLDRPWALAPVALLVALVAGCSSGAQDDGTGNVANGGAPAGTAPMSTPGGTTTPGTPPAGSAGGTSAGTGSGVVPVTGGSTGSSASAGGTSSTTGSASTGAGGTTAGTSATAGGAMSGKLAPSKRNPKYKSVAPALGQPLPAAAPGTWAYTDIEGALSRDGSPAGFYYKFSKTGSKNVFIYMVGGGACQDTFFCNMNPPNKNFSLTAESIGSGVFNVLGPNDEPQDPKLPRWNSGIFKDDMRNPVKDWNAVYIPYVTGDVYAGSKPNGTVPNVDGTHQFVGKSNMMKFISRIVATFKDAPVVMLTGSSAGGLGALLNAPYVMDAYIDVGLGARGFVVDDAGPFFDDPYLEVCLQQRYRDLFGLNASFPEDCENCKGQGGGIAKAYLAYLVDKYPDNLLGGLIDSESDEIMSFFFSEGLEECGYVDNPLLGVLVYPEDRYKNGLKNLLDVHMKRMSSYVWPGIEHQNFFTTDSGDRFYEMNGLQKTPAQWLTKLLSGEMERLGL